MAAPTPAPISYISVLALGPGLDSLVRTRAGSGQAKLPGHRHCPRPVKRMAAVGKDQKHPLDSSKIQVLNTSSHHQWFGITWMQPQPGKGIWGWGGVEGGGNEGTSNQYGRRNEKQTTA